MLQPFFVLATQNPLEMEGTYPLPEAQLDRFLLQTPGDISLGGRSAGDYPSHHRRSGDESRAGG
ncbi:MAG: AAA family ATPase [Thermomicrobiales bacterium]